MIRIVLAAVVAALIAAAAWYFWPAPPPPPPASIATAPPAAAPKGPLHPVPAAEPVPLPGLAQSDAAMLDALSGILGAQAVTALLYPEDLVRRIVATIDNLPREAYAARLNPARPPQGAMATTGRDESLAISPANARRYEPYVRALEAVVPQRMAAIYFRLYPLFQQAYVELGYPNGYFNDRLVEVIDHLLEAPDAVEPIRIAAPHVLYEFVDADLESLSSGQKLVMRMGAANEARVKAKLRAIRAEVSAHPPPR